MSPLVPTNALTDEVLCDAMALLGGHGLGQYVEGWLLETLQVRLTTSVAPEFWTGLKQPEGECQERDRANALLKAFRNLLQQLEPFLGMSQLYFSKAYVFLGLDRYRVCILLLTH